MHIVFIQIKKYKIVQNNAYILHKKYTYHSPERSCYGRNNLADEPIEVGVGGALYKKKKKNLLIQLTHLQQYINLYQRFKIHQN